jgi:hypothetical protein
MKYRWIFWLVAVILSLVVVTLKTADPYNEGVTRILIENIFGDLLQFGWFYFVGVYTDKDRIYKPEELINFDGFYVFLIAMLTILKINSFCLTAVMPSILGIAISTRVKEIKRNKKK